jgi:hypothetical protein
MPKPAFEQMSLLPIPPSGLRLKVDVGQAKVLAAFAA